MNMSDTNDQIKHELLNEVLNMMEEWDVLFPVAKERVTNSYTDERWRQLADEL